MKKCGDRSAEQATDAKNRKAIGTVVLNLGLSQEQLSSRHLVL